MTYPRNPGVFSGNPFKIGLFGSNCEHGLAFVDFPERWSGSWPDNLALARLADENGIECLVANARWKGYGGGNDVNLRSLETLTWACGLLANTRSLNVFPTIHVPLVNPVFAAKQLVTIDHIAEGRLGVNLVLGSKEDEFRMFGVPLDDHDRRYDHGEAWWRLVTTIWSNDKPFDVQDEFFDVRGVVGMPHPYGNKRPAMMNAGMSGKGREFAVNYSDLHFDLCVVPEERAATIHATKALAADRGRAVQEWTAASVVCRPTKREADEFIAYCLEHADWSALDARDAMRLSPKSAQLETRDELEEVRRRDAARAILARGHFSAHGTPDRVATELARLAAAGLDGVAIGFVDYLAELPYFIQEVLPRLERLGLRRSTAAVPA